MFRLMILAVLIVLPMGAAWAGDTKEERFERLLFGFMETAFWRGDYHEAHIPPTRWLEPIRLRVDRDPDDELSGIAVEIVRRLGDIAGIPVEVLPRDGTGENFLVTFVSNESGRSGLSQSVRDSGAMKHTHINVNMNYRYAFRRTHIIRHESMHGMGLSGHSHSLDSILSYAQFQGREDISENDVVLLKLLYHPEMKPGSAHLPALLKARELLAAWLGIEGELSRLGRSVFDRQIQRMEAAAAEGDADMLVQLGDAYASGVYVPKDPEKAAELYRKAAALGDNEGAARLAHALERLTPVLTIGRE